jgi:tetratricopeptide (TPR) repeat protein
MNLNNTPTATNEAPRQPKKMKPSNWKILNNIGKYCEFMKQYERAEEFYRKAMNCVRELQNIEYLSCMTDVARICFLRDKVDESIVLNTHSFNELIRLLGPNHNLTKESGDQLQATLRAIGLTELEATEIILASHIPLMQKFLEELS